MKHAFSFHFGMSLALLLLIPACIAKAGAVEKVLQVPASNDSLANIINAAALEMFDSTSVDDIVYAPSRPQSGALLLAGDDEGVTTATLRAALRKLSPESARFRTSVCFLGDAKYDQGLKAAAEKNCVSVFTVQGN